MHLAQRCCHCWKYFWNSCCGIAFRAFVTFFFFFLFVFGVLKYLSLYGSIVFGDSRKSFEAKSGEWGGCSISVIDFWARNCLTAPCELEHCHDGESNVGPKFYTHLYVTTSIYTYNKLGLYLYVYVNAPDSSLFERFHRFCEILHDHFPHVPRSCDPVCTIFAIKKHLTSS
jgi:hypothetical protein